MFSLSPTKKTAPRKDTKLKGGKGGGSKKKFGATVKSKPPRADSALKIGRASTSPSANEADSDDDDDQDSDSSTKSSKFNCDDSNQRGNGTSNNN